MPEILTAEEVAQRLRVRPSWVRYAAADGRIRSHRVGRYLRFIWAEVEEDFLVGTLGV